jgi:hypothetical protein
MTLMDDVYVWSTYAFRNRRPIPTDDIILYRDNGIIIISILI